MHTSVSHARAGAVPVPPPAYGFAAIPPDRTRPLGRSLGRGRVLSSKTSREGSSPGAPCDVQLSVHLAVAFFVGA